LDKLVNEFDMEEDFPAYGVIGVPDLTEVDEGVDGGEEGTVEPATTLRYEFRDSI